VPVATRSASAHYSSRYDNYASYRAQPCHSECCSISVCRNRTRALRDRRDRAQITAQWIDLEARSRDREDEQRTA
jgi:hypothetical protein